MRLMEELANSAIACARARESTRIKASLPGQIKLDGTMPARPFLTRDEPPFAYRPPPEGALYSPHQSCSVI